MRRNHALLAGISLAASSWAQTWLPLPAAGPGPGSWSMVSDSLRSRLVLVGGNGTQTETWTFAGVAWSLATPPASPPARIGHGLSYDIARGVVVLFGGADSTGTMLRNDLWEYDGVAWSQRMPAASPSPRAAVGMVYDAARGMHVLFGGTTVPSAPMVCGVTDETWLWDGANWQQAAPATLPPARAQPAMAYDPARGRVVMVGGSGFGVPHCSVTFWFDTFEWDGVNWNERAIEHPSALQTSGFAAHGPVRGAVLVNPLVTGLATETWEYDGFRWYRYQVLVPPFGRFDLPTLSTSPWSGQPTAFVNNGSGNGMWEFGGATAAVAAFGLPCASATSAGAALQALDLPALGTTLRIRVAATPNPAFTFLFGSLGAPIDVPLAGTSCRQLLQPPFSITSTTLAAFFLPIPLAPALHGVVVHFQGAVPAPGANPLGVLLTDGLRAVLN